MDTAYDHIQEENFPKDLKPKSSPPKTGAPLDTNVGEAAAEEAPPGNLNEEFQEAYKAISSSPWGMKLGGYWGTLKKASEQYIEEAQRTTTAAGSQATKGLTELMNRTRSLSLATSPTIGGPEEKTTGSADEDKDVTPHPDRPESLPADIVREATTLVSRFRSEAAKRLKDIERAEDAADEALLRLGTNIRSFLKDAIAIAPPTEIAELNADGTASGKVLFQSTDTDGKRTIHTSRLEAQLHVIHCNLDSFLKDPTASEYADWEKEFTKEKLDSLTAIIGRDLDKYTELRSAMEALVPEKVEYGTFWRRYYFLRKVAESEEVRRKELLKGAASNAEQEEAGWDDDSEDEGTPNADIDGSTATLGKKTVASKALAKAEGKAAPSRPLRLEPPRPHDVLSQPDSDASYDLVSAATSRAGGSPRDVKTVEEESDEDWE